MHIYIYIYIYEFTYIHMLIYIYAVSAQESSIDGLVTPMDSMYVVCMYSQCIHANTQTRTYIYVHQKRITIYLTATHCNTLQPDTAHYTSLSHYRFIH